MSGTVAAAALAGIAATAAIDAGSLKLMRGRTVRDSVGLMIDGALPRSRDARASRWGTFTAAICAAGAVLPFAGIPLALLVGATAPPVLRRLDRSLVARRLSEIERRIPGIARAMADAIAAGSGVEQAAASVGASTGGRIGRSLVHVSVDCVRGLSVGEALARLSRPPLGGPWEPLATAVELHRWCGGDLPASLRAVAEASEDLAQARAAARAATAQARFTASLVCAMPVFFAGIAGVVRPDLIASILSQPIPAMLVAASVVLQVVCLAAIRALGSAAAR